MNARKREISDDDIDQLLASRLKDTRPEFEARWVELKRTLRQEPARSRAWAPTLWSTWLAAGVVAAVLVVMATRRSATASLDRVALEELWAMESVLADGTALLDTDNRTDLLHLAANTPLNLQ